METDYIEGTGPDSPGGVPHKTGFARWWAAMRGNMWAYWLASLAAALGFLPYVAVLSFSVVNHLAAVLLVGAALGGMVAGPLLCPVLDLLLRGYRDELFRFRASYARAVLRDWRQSLLPGAVFGEVAGVQIFMLYHIAPGGDSLPYLVCLMAGAIVLCAFAVWLWPQIVLFDMPLGQMLKNTLVLAASQIPRTIGAALVLFGYTALLLALNPLSLIFFPVIGIWLPLSIALCMIYAPLEKAFNIEEGVRRLNERQEDHS